MTAYMQNISEEKREEDMHVSLLGRSQRTQQHGPGLNQLQWPPSQPYGAICDEDVPHSVHGNHATRQHITFLDHQGVHLPGGPLGEREGGRRRKMRQAADPPSSGWALPAPVGVIDRILLYGRGPSRYSVGRTPGTASHEKRMGRRANSQAKAIEADHGYLIIQWFIMLNKPPLRRSFDG